MAIDDAAFARLQEIGRERGRVTTEDLSRVLPVDRMPPGDLALAVERLEAAGIDVDLDPALMAPRADSRPDRGAGDAGVVDIASPAAPAVSAPGVRPSTSHDVASMGATHGHGTRRAPTWERGGIDLLPVVAIGAVALVMIVALG